MRIKQNKLESRYVTVHGSPWHYVTSMHPVFSDAPSIIMVHGLVVSHRYMVPTGLCLAPYYNVYIPDLPGFGKSYKPVHALDIPELADALMAWMRVVGLTQAVFLGNSLGCQIIAHFAMRYPECIHKAILVGPTMDPKALTAHQEIARWLVNLPGEPFHLYPIVIRDFLDIGFRRFVATFRYGLKDRIDQHLPHMHIPTLVARGSRDTVVPQQWAEGATGLLPDGELIVISGAAHDVNYNSPKALSNVVRGFVG